jgi:hypothetical protein
MAGEETSIGSGEEASRSGDQEVRPGRGVAGCGHQGPGGLVNECHDSLLDLYESPA